MYAAELAVFTVFVWMHAMTNRATKKNQNVRYWKLPLLRSFIRNFPSG